LLHRPCWCKCFSWSHNHSMLIWPLNSWCHLICICPGFHSCK
jgi:hypothetical protein